MCFSSCLPIYSSTLRAYRLGTCECSYPPQSSPFTLSECLRPYIPLPVSLCSVPVSPSVLPSSPDTPPRVEVPTTDSKRASSGSSTERSSLYLTGEDGSPGFWACILRLRASGPRSLTLPGPLPPSSRDSHVPPLTLNLRGDVNKYLVRQEDGITGSFSRVLDTSYFSG